MKLQLALGLGRPRVRVGESPDMILVYEIPAPSTDIELAVQANSTWFSAGQSVVIDWGDGSTKEDVSDTGVSTYIGHTYTDAGTYTIKISGSMKMYGRDSGVDILGQTLLTRVDSFGNLGITSFLNAFRGCTGLISVPKTLPSKVTNTSSMFYNCSGAAFNPDVSNWDVSKVENMNLMFYYCSGASFNPYVSNWDVSKVENMSGMFQYCSGAAFNPDVSNWDVRNVTQMSSMFGSCSGAAFSPDVSNWDVRKVENMSSLFYNCSGAAFNPDVSNWDVRNVTNMPHMFRSCYHQNFRGGRGVDGLGIGIANWIPKSLLTGASTGLSNFMLGAKEQDATYLDSILNAWAALIGDIVNPLPTGITCHFGTTKYTSAGAASHAQLTASTSSGGAAWTILSGGLQV